MEYLHNGFTLEISEGAFPLGTDSIALAEFAKLPRNATVLDLGAGCGTLGLLLCADHSDCKVTGIELDSSAHITALDNIARNKLEGRATSICADLRQLDDFITAGSYHCCISNPPYFSGGPASKTLATARRNDTCSTEDLFKAAAKALRYSGDFFLVHRPEMLAELCAYAHANQLEPKRLRLIRHKVGGPVSLVLLSCRKGGKPGLIWEENALRDASGDPTPYYNKLYHLQEV